MDAISRFTANVVKTTYENLRASTVEATKTFLLDTLGVCVAGSTVPGVAELVDLLRGWGGTAESTLLVFGGKLPAPWAAMANSVMMHNLEFDCVHDAAVIHPFTTALPAALAVAEAQGGVSGKTLLTAVAVGVDTSTRIGMSSRARMTFFRPGVCGAFGATAAVAKVVGCDLETTSHAMGTLYSQICGTLQSHHEGVMINSMQTGFNAKAAVLAVALAQRGIAGPQHVLEGEYGYFRLFEGAYDLSAALHTLGQTWEVEHVSHKPFPSGRLTHGAVEAALTLRQQHHIQPQEIAEVVVEAPPLVKNLVGRALTSHTPSAQFARLCIPFVLAHVFLKGDVFIPDFTGAALTDPQVHALAAKIHVERHAAIQDENAMVPLTVHVRLHDGRQHSLRLDALLGSPEKPLSRAEHLHKFQRCWQHGGRHLPTGNAECVIDMVQHLEEVDDVADLCRLLVP
jgi:2-methylcitrate dehydratase PrpD